MTEIITVIFVLAAGITAILVWANVRTTSTIWSFQEGVVFRHGKFVKVLQPGRHAPWGAGYEVRKIEKNLRQLTVQSQEITTADKVAVKVSVIANYRVADSLKFVTEAQMPEQILYSAVQLALREMIGTEPIDDVLESKSGYGSQLKLSVIDSAASVGIQIESIDIRDVILGGDLKKAYAGVLLARKDALAGLEKARSEAAALRTLANGARLFESNPQLLQLRYLQLLENTRQSGASTLVRGPAMDEILKQQIVSR
ncbi:MAG: regulator of protease activity HflC (stomatin/prohibitin superfamily) [Verrucomicrobiales bacterium]|jgi:regulator of protease activity HflC (stomatin/prohibitin superfamily)